MKTWVYIDKDGNTVTVFHATDKGTRKWEHPMDKSDLCQVCIDLKIDEG